MSGVANIINNIIAEGDQQGVHSALLYSSADDHLPLPGQTHYQVRMQREINIYKDWLALQKIKAVIRVFKPDIIHCHSAKAGVLGRLAAKQLKIACCYSPHCYAFLRTDVSWCKNKFYYYIEKCIANYTQATTIASGQSEYQLAKQFSTAMLINNAVNVTETTTKLIAKQTTLIVSVGRLSAQKGISLYKHVVQALPTEIQWLWVGDGEQKTQLAALPNVTITGWLPKAKVIEHLLAASIYFQSSAWEVLPTSLLEAACLRKPIVCSNIAGHRDIISANNNGLLFNNVQEAVQAITTLRHNVQLGEMLGQAVYQTVRTTCNSSLNSPEYYLCYQRLLSAR